MRAVIIDNSVFTCEENNKVYLFDNEEKAQGFISVVFSGYMSILDSFLSNSESKLQENETYCEAEKGRANIRVIVKSEKENYEEIRDIVISEIDVCEDFLEKNKGVVPFTVR